MPINKDLSSWLESLAPEKRKQALEALGNLVNDDPPDPVIIAARKAAGLSDSPPAKLPVDKIREAAGLASSEPASNERE